MTTPLQKAAQALLNSWDSPRLFTDSEFEELRKALDAELQQAVEPVAWRWDILPDSPLMKRKGQKSGVYLENPKDIGIDVNGVKSLENYKWTPLYLHPPQPQAATPVPDLLKEFKNVMSWIDNWSPEFSCDPDWPDDRDKAHAAIAAAQGEKP